jgi:hypothetical protein
MVHVENELRPHRAPLTQARYVESPTETSTVAPSTGYDVPGNGTWKGDEREIRHPRHRCVWQDDSRPVDGMGHEVTVGTRSPEETKSRAEPDAYGNPHSALGKRNTLRSSSPHSAKRPHAVRCFNAKLTTVAADKPSHTARLSSALR